MAQPIFRILGDYESDFQGVIDYFKKNKNIIDIEKTGSQVRVEIDMYIPNQFESESHAFKYDLLILNTRNSRNHEQGYDIQSFLDKNLSPNGKILLNQCCPCCDKTMPLIIDDRVEENQYVGFEINFFVRNMIHNYVFE